MAPTTVHLPNGQNLVVTPVFGGLFFKTNDLNNHHSPFPAGWTIIINSEHPLNPDHADSHEEGWAAADEKRNSIQRFRQPTMQSDHLFISSISNPSSQDFKPAHSPTRQIAMMLWATLYWYFHQTEPNLRVVTTASKHTPAAGRPEGDWRIWINREGIFKGKVVLPKLERMGLISSEESMVGPDQNDTSAEGWTRMFVSRRSFWQLDPRIYLFTLPQINTNSPFSSGSPYPSRPSSPLPGAERDFPKDNSIDLHKGLWSPSAPGPFHSGSHLPTYYPPPPPQYIVTDNVRHPIRPKPPRQGEIFYSRYIPSLGEYLSFRVASLSPKPVRHCGPVSWQTTHQPPRTSTHMPASDSNLPSLSSPHLGKSDTEHLHTWMNNPRVSHFWGESGPLSHQEDFLRAGLSRKNSFPVIGCFDDKPFGYFEIYWVKEDPLGRYVDRVGDYDRGFHCLVGEQEFRGEHRVKVWLSAIVHYLWLADNRTETVMLEPRVDNEKLAQYCLDAGFYRERVINMPHKQANLLKIERSAWEAPAL
ncbi:hypothetical protein M011DRAFT_465734 [Sporormia fimetaria CBS 119925]|uniref:Acyltransferase MbtK/IucB-like conserved domain-containing protein n=1 Tax=Sporormia fimetaria CBS 119925 TaxID=1340428 RepID=A0A6A6VJJ9_9PLEO|nr:hypothetical protein M011DRAFT_465734 [Sporormia fimetaria CBS 119925]